MKLTVLFSMVAISIVAHGAINSDCEYTANVQVFTNDGKPVPEKSFSTQAIRKMIAPGNYQFSEASKDKSASGRIDFTLTWAKAPFHVESEVGNVSGVCVSPGYCVGKTVGKKDSKMNSTFVTQFDSHLVRATSITDSNITVQELTPKNKECAFQ